jgi:hypothetical protein
MASIFQNSCAGPSPQRSPRPHSLTYKRKNEKTSEDDAAETLSVRSTRHSQAAKTLELIECAARLGDPDINAVLRIPLLVWTTPTLEEIPYTEELRQLYLATEPIEPVPPPAEAA